MLKKNLLNKFILLVSLFWLSGFNAMAEADGVRIVIETKGGDARVSVETSGSNESVSKTEFYSVPSQKYKEVPAKIYFPPKLPFPMADHFYEKRNRKGFDRQSVSERSRKRYGGPKCEWDEDCEDICKDIYNRRSVRDDCMELPVKQVEKLEEIYETFENPSDNDLASIDSVDFETFVEIDLRPLDTLIGKLSSSEAKRVLAWIADDPDIAEVFQEEDDEYDLLKKLLQNLNPDIKTALNQKIAVREFISATPESEKLSHAESSFMEIIIDNNETALDWVHNFFYEECAARNDEEVCIFNDWYCQVGLNDDYWDSLLDFEDVEQIVDDLLDDYDINSSAPTCWTEAVADEDDADDLTAKCVESLCGKTFTPK